MKELKEHDYDIYLKVKEELEGKSNDNSASSADDEWINVFNLFFHI